MQVNKVIIHELSKSVGAIGAKLRTSESLMDHTHSDVITLVKDLNKRYGRRDEKQGVFDKNNTTTFHDGYIEFHNDNSDSNFIKFSHDSAKNLSDRIENITAARGGYLIYATYHDYRPYCSVFFVRDTTGIFFKRNETVNSFDLNKVKHIDFERLAMACRINMEVYGQQDKKYLSFIHNKKDESSKYFINWISSTDNVSSEEETKQLLAALRRIPMPINEETNTPYIREEIFKSIHTEINSSATKTVNLFACSKKAFNDEEYLSNYMYEHYPEVPTEFKAYYPTLKKFIKVFVKADDIELNFPLKIWKDKIVRFNAKNENQIIISSKNLADQIREYTKTDDTP